MRAQVLIRLKKSLEQMLKVLDLADLQSKRKSSTIGTTIILLIETSLRLNIGHPLPRSARLVQDLSHLRIRVMTLVQVNIQIIKSLDQMSKVLDLVDLRSRRKLLTIETTTTRSRENFLRLDTSQFLRRSVRLVQDLNHLQIRVVKLVQVNIQIIKSLDQMSKVLDLVDLQSRRKLLTIETTIILPIETSLRLDTSQFLPQSARLVQDLSHLQIRVAKLVQVNIQIIKSLEQM